MADKAISELVAASAVGSTDLFVLEQGGVAKKLTGQILENWLVALADGHGGIQSIEYTAPTPPSLTGTMTITLADQTVYTVNVQNGRSITGITWTSSGTPGDGQTHTGTIAYNDGTTSTFTFEDGVKGDQGDAWYSDFKWAADLPTSDADMGEVPDNYIGVYFGTTPLASLHYSDYAWFEYKGEKGDTGDPATLTSDDIAYQWSNNGTVIPSGTWSPTIPARVTGQNFLWTQISLSFNTGSPVTAYTVGHYGEDGTGAVSTVNAISPVDGNVTITASDIQTSTSASVEARLGASEDRVTALETYEALHIQSASFSALPYTISNSAITADMRVVEAQFSKPSELSGDVTWTTAAGSITLSGSINGATSVDLILIKTN